MNAVKAGLAAGALLIAASFMTQQVRPSNPRTEIFKCPRRVKKCLGGQHP